MPEHVSCSLLARYALRLAGSAPEAWASEPQRVVGAPPGYATGFGRPLIRHPRVTPIALKPQQGCPHPTPGLPRAQAEPFEVDRIAKSGAAGGSAASASRFCWR